MTFKASGHRHVTAARNHDDKKRPRAGVRGDAEGKKRAAVLTFLALLGDGGGRQQAEDEGDEQQGGGATPGHRRHVRRGFSTRLLTSRDDRLRLPAPRTHRTRAADAMHNPRARARDPYET